MSITICYCFNGKFHYSLPVSKLNFWFLSLILSDYDPVQPVTPTTPSQPLKPGTAVYGTTKDNGGFYYIGRTLAHTAKIVGIEFGYRENTIETLISISDDQ